MAGPRDSATTLAGSHQNDQRKTALREATNPSSETGRSTICLFTSTPAGVRPPPRDLQCGSSGVISSQPGARPARLGVRNARGEAGGGLNEGRQSSVVCSSGAILLIDGRILESLVVRAFRKAEEGRRAASEGIDCGSKFLVWSESRVHIELLVFAHARPLTGPFDVMELDDIEV